jgi:hypothetical protein
MCSLSFAATIAVVDKPLFKYRGNVVEDKVMDNPVAEIGSKHFPFHGFIDDETDAWPWFVPAVYNFIAKFDQIVFVVKFKFQGIVCIPLVASIITLTRTIRFRLICFVSCKIRINNRIISRCSLIFKINGTLSLWEFAL